MLPSPPPWPNPTQIKAEPMGAWNKEVKDLFNNIPSEGGYNNYKLFIVICKNKHDKVCFFAQTENQNG
jgi:hypothetical protein